MATLIGTVVGIAALASFDADAVAPKFFNQRGFSGFVRNGAGDYSLTLAQPENMSTDAIVKAGVGGVGDTTIACEVVSTSVVRVRTFTNNVAADVDFWIEIGLIGPN